MNIIIKHIKGFLFKVFALMTLSLSAQHVPQHSMYMHNMTIVNPAFSGTKKALNITAASKLQWVGLEGAPRSNILELHTPLKDKNIGLGLSVLTENIGPVNSSTAKLNYAYRIKISNTTNISMGLGAGINNYHISLSDLAKNQNENDLSKDFLFDLQPIFALGGFIYSPNYQLGISLSSLVEADIRGLNSSDIQSQNMNSQLYVTGAYNFNISSTWSVSPMFLYKYEKNSSAVLDLTALVNYNNKIEAGASYRLNDAVIALLSLQLTNQIKIGYAYDFTISGLSNVSSGSHEVMVNYSFVEIFSKNIKSPRFF